MPALRRIPAPVRASLVDAAVIVLAYVIAVVVRVGGRLERVADVDLAVAFSIGAALLQVAGNWAAGAYRADRPLRAPRDVLTLFLPALGVAALVGLVSLTRDTRPIALAALPTAVVLSTAAETVIRLRPRLGAIARAAFGREAGQPEPVRFLPGVPDVEATLLGRGSTIRDAILAIDRDVSRMALVVDDARRLLGTITDGDVRRAILASADVGGPCTTIMKATPVVAHEGTTDDEILGLMQRNVVRQVPLLDRGGRVLDIKLIELLSGAPLERTPVLIMAGGRGTRLGDIALTTPKPLVRVAGRPILETIVRDLALQGFQRVVLAVAYRSEQIERYFGNGHTFGLDITYVREDEPLGTAGAIRLVAPSVEGPLVVTNADVLTRLSFRDLVEFHRAQRHELTIGIIASSQQLRYGIVETDGARVTALREKPELRYMVNAGIYVVEPHLARFIPEGVRFDMDALISAALRASVRVGGFPIHEYWADVGVPADLERATREYPAQLARARN